MKKELIEKNPLLKLSFEFSLLILTYCDLLNQFHKHAISKQLLRCGTSMGANSMEAQNAESKADFIHKIKIAAKEADETQYWITLCEFAGGYPDTVVILNKLTELQKSLPPFWGLQKEKHHSINFSGF